MNKYLYAIVLLSLFCTLWPKQSKAEVSDPCPDSIEALSATPDDLSKVQADIDRFTLCVERAQLLKRLNDLALENQDDLQSLPLIDPTIQITPLEMTPSEVQEGVVVQEQDQVVDWEILSIFGSGLDLSAKLINREGLFAQIKAGDELSDGRTVVDVTKTSVTLAQGKERDVIEWLDSITEETQ